MEHVHGRKKVILVYGYGEGAPWFPILKMLLEEHGCEVTIPVMPHPWWPRVEEWVKRLQEIVPQPDRDTYMLGYSVGASTVLRYVEEMPGAAALGGLIAVALFSQYQVAAKIPCLLTRGLHAERIKNKVQKIGVVQSSNDWRAPVSNGEWLNESVGASLAVVPRAGHFDHVTEPPYEIVKMVERIIIQGQ